MMMMASLKWWRSIKCWLLCLSLFCVINFVMLVSLRHGRCVTPEIGQLESQLTITKQLMPLQSEPSKTFAGIPQAVSLAITNTNTNTNKLPSIEDNCRPVPEKFPRQQQLLPCNWRTSRPNCTHRFRVALRCTNSSPDIFEERVKVGMPPVAVSFNDSCLMRVVRQRCSQTGRPVPRVVHYVNFSPTGKQGRELPIYTFLGLVSVIRFIQPCLLLFHADYLPFGQHWEALLQLTSRVIHVNRTAPASVFGQMIERIEHKSDVARLEAMRAFGGIYLDTDEVILQPMDDLMEHHVTMAWEKVNSAFGNGLFLAEPNNTFLNVWYDKYRTFSNTWWAYFSTTLPQVLYKKHPEFNINVVNTFFKPNLYNITQLFYEGRYDWSNHYALHLYYRRNQRFFRGNFEEKNTTLGDMARHILFGDKQRCVRL